MNKGMCQGYIYTKGAIPTIFWTMFTQTTFICFACLPFSKRLFFDYFPVDKMNPVTRMLVQHVRIITGSVASVMFCGSTPAIRMSKM